MFITLIDVLGLRLKGYTDIFAFSKSDRWMYLSELMKNAVFSNFKILKIHKCTYIVLFSTFCTLIVSCQQLSYVCPTWFYYLPGKELLILCTLPEISKWQQSLHLLSFTVNSWEHICSTTHWFLSASHHEAVHFVCLHFCMETVTDWLVLIQWSTSMVTCFPVWILIKHEPVFFSQGCVLAVRVGAVFLALICSCSSECHQIFTVPSLMSQLSILLASFISFDTEK